MKLHNISNFWSRGTTIAVCCKRLGVEVTDSSCTLRYSGSFKLSLARSWTDLVWVAENSKVCLFLGSCDTIAFKAFLNPTSRIRSASSRTKTCFLARNSHPNEKLNNQYLKHACMCKCEDMLASVCVCTRMCVCMYVCVRVREREREVKQGSGRVGSLVPKKRSVN